MTHAPDRTAIAAAESLIRPHIRRTPVLEVDATDVGLGGQPITLKLEYLQHSGTFKARGAFTNLLTRDGAENGVVAASGGNHGAAVAYAARKLGHRARIYVPSISSPAKIARIESYGAEVIVGGAQYPEALAASRDWAEEHDALQLHAYDSRETLTGQGTVGLEWQQQSPDLDTLLVAVGGGGLIGGIASWYRGDIRVVGVEPETAPTLYEALAAGEPVDVPVSGIAADSLGARRIGSLMFPMAQQYIDRSVLVTDQDITDAKAALWNVLRVVAEPGGAAALAALLSGAYKPEPGERVGVLLCGANTAVSFG